jgi:hypothetical protein
MAFATPAAALDAADRAAIQRVIENQLAAFARDDGAAAFAFAAPDIRAKFRNAEAFMAMVRAAYEAVYRPRRVDFIGIDEAEPVPVQEVRLEGPDGNLYLARYPMQRQPDGRRLIAGCYLFSAAGESAAMVPPMTATLSIKRVEPKLAAANTRVGRFATFTGSRVSASHIST